VRESAVDFLQIMSVTKTFDGIKALSDISFSLQEGRLTGLIGPNGAGKTTLFNLITGEYPLTGGEIHFCGKNIARLKSYQRTYLGIARTFQNLKIFPDLSVMENVMVGLHSRTRSSLLHACLRLPLHRREERANIGRTQEVLEFLGIDALSDEMVGDLPYGQKRLVEICRSLVMEPKLLLLDEPCAGLNSHEAQELAKKLREISTSGTTILCVEHNMRFIMSLAKQIIVLDYGQKIAEGSPEEIMGNQKVIDAYLGDAKRE
jgi:branched-chain amino acid transport system ATP-binding protein